MVAVNISLIQIIAGDKLYNVDITCLKLGSNAMCHVGTAPQVQRKR